MEECILEALQEMKPTSIVGVELQEVELGSSAPQILGIKVQLTAVLRVQEAYCRRCRHGVAPSFVLRCWASYRAGCCLGRFVVGCSRFGVNGHICRCLSLVHLESRGHRRWK